MVCGGDFLSTWRGLTEALEHTNLAPWKESFSGAELTGEMLRSGQIWDSAKSDADLSQTGSYTKTVNGVLWTYKKESSGAGISISASSQKPNAYRAGYVGNYDFFTKFFQIFY